MEERKDKRERRTIQVQMNMAEEGERALFEYHKKSSKKGKWKEDFVNALTLYRELIKGRVDRLQTLFPEIINAVRLYLDIQEGRLSVMQELFPERYKVFRLQLEADILENINQDNQKDVLRQLRSIEAEILSLKASGISNQAPQGIGGIKQLGTLAIPDPTFDDDEDSDLFGVRKDENASQRVANNFLASIGQAQNIKADPSIKYGRQK